MLKRALDRADRRVVKRSAGKLHLLRGTRAIPAAAGMAAYGLSESQRKLFTAHIVDEFPDQVPFIPLRDTPPNMDDLRVQPYDTHTLSGVFKRLDLIYRAKSVRGVFSLYIFLVC